MNFHRTPHGYFPGEITTAFHTCSLNVRRAAPLPSPIAYSFLIFLLISSQHLDPRHQIYIYIAGGTLEFSFSPHQNPFISRGVPQRKTSNWTPNGTQNGQLDDTAENPPIVGQISENLLVFVRI